MNTRKLTFFALAATLLCFLGLGVACHGDSSRSFADPGAMLTPLDPGLPTDPGYGDDEGTENPDENTDSPNSSDDEASECPSSTCNP